jgi:hypothetical protein
MFINTWRSAVLIVGETCLLIGAVTAATYLRLGDYAWSVLMERDGILRVILVVGVSQICLHFADLYDLRHHRHA